MKTTLLQLPGLLLVVGLLATCTEQPTMAPDNDVEAVTPTLSSVVACDLVSQMTSDVRDYFQMPERRDASAEMRLLGDACAAGTATLMTSLSIGLLQRMETAAQTNRGLSAVSGARLAQALLACTTATEVESPPAADVGCSASAVAMYSLPSLSDLELALSQAAGLFAVRVGTNGSPAIARAKVPFDLTNGGLFGTQLTTGSWTAANGGGSLVLIYGFPITPSVRETTVGNLGYSFNRWPDPGLFIADGLVIVGVCFTNDVDVPHPATVESARGRMQRDDAEGTLLSFHAPTFSQSECRTPPLNASLFGPARNFALSLLPRAWSAMFMSDRKTPVIGGGSIDWSDFAPVGADTAGSLEIIEPPKTTYSVNEPLMIRVLAQSGGETPMERVPVEIYVAGNSGKPAGAIVTDLDGSANDGTWGYTSEVDGTILFDMAGLGKPGGYTVCARVKSSVGFAGFTFTEDCTEGVFNVSK